MLVTGVLWLKLRKFTQSYIVISFFVNYKIIQITCPEDFRDILIAELSLFQGYDSFLETDEGFEAYVEVFLFDEATLTQVFHRYPAVSISYTLEEVSEKNWNVEWESNFEPIIVEDQCLVRATFHKIPKKYPYEIIIDPKMAFGTGHHATTYLMLSWQLVIEHKGKAVMDAGCGTGILSIMAHQRGAAEILAFDNNEWAVENSKENFGINACEQIRLFQGTVADVDIIKKFDIILANINRNVLLEEMDDYAHLLHPNGTLLLSGFFQEDAPLIIERATTAGLKVMDERTRNKWCSILLQQ
jgi:ribosomal protein L11 methyltransferase